MCSCNIKWKKNFPFLQWQFSIIVTLRHMHVCWGNYVTLFSINFNWDCNQNNFKLLSCFWIVRYISRRYWHGSWGGKGGGGERGKGYLTKVYTPSSNPLPFHILFYRPKMHLYPPFPRSCWTMSLKRNMCLKFILISQSHCHPVMKAQRIYFDYITWTCTGKYYICIPFLFQAFPRHAGDSSKHSFSKI